MQNKKSDESRYKKLYEEQIMINEVLKQEIKDLNRRLRDFLTKTK